MAENIIDVVTKQLKKEESVLYSPSNTKQLPISGGDVGGSAGFIRFKEDKGTEVWRNGPRMGRVEEIGEAEWGMGKLALGIRGE